MKHSRCVVRLACLAAICLLGGALAGAAQAAPASAPTPATVAAAPAAAASVSAAPAAAAPAASDATPAAATAAAQPFDPEAATEAYLNRLTPEQRSRSDAYYEGGYWLVLWDFIYGAAVLLLLLATGLSASMRDLAERRFSFAPTFAYVVMFMVASWVLGFPLSVYEDFVREHQYGMANQQFGGWFVEQLKQLAVSVVVSSILITVLYAIVRRARRTWWIWGAVATTLFGAFLVLVEPVFIEPIFNKYTELQDPTVREPILSLARANGIPAQHVYVVDASKQTKRMSANVAGLLGTTRIALNDNLLNRAKLHEIEAVMGHEMGHYVMHHVSKSLLFLMVMLVAGFAFMQFGFEGARTRWGANWRIRDIGDAAGLPLVLLLASIFVFVTRPVYISYGRTQEAEADQFGLNAARQPDGMAEAALHLSEYRKLSPGPIEEIIFFDHPSGRNRILAAMRWKAEHLNEPPVCHP
jgi:STE24 endopeptidase